MLAREHTWPALGLSLAAVAVYSYSLGHRSRKIHPFRPETQSEWRIALPVSQHRDSTLWRTLAASSAQASPEQSTLSADAN